MWFFWPDHDRRLRNWLFLLLIGGAIQSLGAEPVRPTSTTWLTGTAWREGVDSPVSVEWSGVPLRQALERLGQAQRLAVLIDRRVDPEQAISMQATQQSLRQIVEQVATGQRAGVAFWEPLVYIGPAPVARDVRTWSAIVREEVLAAPAATRARFTRVSRGGWPVLSRPRDLLDQLAAEAGVSLTPLVTVEHDLWAGADLPPMTWTDRVLVVAVQLGLRPKISADGQRVTLVPLAERAVLERRYPPGPSAEATATRYRQRAPEAEVSVVGGQVVVRGQLEDHERLQSPSGTKAAATNVVTEERYTLNISQTPLEQVLKALETRLKLTIRYDRAALAAAQRRLDTPVTFRVDQVTLDALLEAALRPAGLTFRRQEKTVDVIPRTE